MIHALLHIAGLDNASGRWYLWWSGIGADLTLLAAPVVWLRRHNCEIHRCWRLGRHKTETGHMVCRMHHPDDHLKPQDVIPPETEGQSDGTADHQTAGR